MTSPYCFDAYESGIVRSGGSIRAMARNGSPRVDMRELDKATDSAWSALMDANSLTAPPEFFFLLGDQPSRLELDDEDRLVPRPLTVDRMKHRLSQIAEFGRPDEHGKWHAHSGAPIELVKNVLATPNPPLPPLLRIVEVPVLGRDGTIHARPGYSEGHRVFYAPVAGLDVPAVRGRPTHSEIARAVDVIFGDLFADFPFVGDAERAHALCLLLQPFVRDLIDGPTPLFLVEAPTPGSGKGLLVDAACWPAVGGQLPSNTEGSDEDEWRKRITSLLRKSPVAVKIDNLRRPLDSAALSSVLTSMTWEDRELGQSRMLTLPNRATWVATGNNPALSSEIARRTVRIRLDPEVEHPEDRGGFRHHPLEVWATENRGLLVWAALTIARAWVVAGRPPARRSLGSYESWSHVMGGMCEVAKVPGFLGNLDDLRDRATSELDDLHEFLVAWRERFGDEKAKSNEIPPHLVELLGVRYSNERWALQAGKVLATYSDRVVKGLVLRRAGTVGGSATWRVEEARRSA